MSCLARISWQGFVERCGQVHDGGRLISGGRNRADLTHVARANNQPRISSASSRHSLALYLRTFR